MLNLLNDISKMFFKIRENEKIIRKSLLFGLLLLFIDFILLFVFKNNSLFIILVVIAIFGMILKGICYSCFILFDIVYNVFLYWNIIVIVLKKAFLLLSFIIFGGLLSMAISLDILNNYFTNKPLPSQEIEMIISGAMLSIVIMCLLSIAVCYVYMRYQYDRFSYQIILLALNIVLVLIFTFVIGVKEVFFGYFSALINMNDNNFQLEFFNIYNITWDTFIEFMLYWFFALGSSFQLIFKSMYELLIDKNNNKSNKD